MATFNWDELIESAADIEDEFALIEPGTYDVIVLKAEAVTSSGGNDMIKVVYQFPEGGKNSKRRLFNQHVMIPGNPMNLGFFLRAMDAYGLPKAWIAENNPSMGELADAIIGKVVNVKVSVEAHWEAKKAADGVKVNRCGDPKASKGDAALFGTTTDAIPVPSVAPTPKPTSATPQIPNF